MTPQRFSETLVISDNYLAEHVSRWGSYQWAIWRLSDIHMQLRPLPVVFYTQNGSDALHMIEALERKVVAA